MPINIVNKQMQAYNSRDIDSMMELFSENIQIVNFENNHIIIDGIDACKKMYVELFSCSPNLNAAVVNTIEFKNKIIVHEFISGKSGGNEKYEQVIIFEVNKDKIEQINIIRN